MKNIIIIILLFSIGFVCSEEISLDEIINRIDQNEKIASSESIGKQIIITSSGQKRTLSYKSYSKDKNDKQLMIYTAPARIKGDKILMLNNGDDIWFYTPKTDRVRHLASHAKRQKVQGSDFSYEDMAGGNLKDDYKVELLGKEKLGKVNCYKLKLIPKPSGPHYSKMILWADTENFVTRKIDYYEDEELTKRLLLEDFEKIGSHWIAKKMVMENLLESGKTIMETSEIKLDIELKDSIFSTNNLKKH